ncbi:uncharacterized protein LOC6574903 [Drosophila mojavensis]|uniref:Uncharacterized protein, isoform A n=1 Tax=Drosophila mojavensis TaxID=7230 RepID=B4K779_DROMO|nr:uncharacterized protein LOC6574903 [Drosophila mojavensis]XP_015023199.1 uncharacterized protein LOC6574903 [Drosophila mojavensis]XP_043864016.1 uncharacterized protein LOC6574903 [Drosophila mojavensis]XP_043864017.1 uncharacterized protein LOC6574903 [Drosophila mojavensis]EDW16392.2 uncharacterized protein Dmoj_GI10511, isoform A [Drosophila mojavensis]KRG02093.1 uncharacterized protein Dmoj_GI10511, isoform B [Drosophila mojavensis]
MLMPRYSEQESHSEKSFAGKHNHASTTVAAHTKMRLISKVEHNMRQQQQQQQEKQKQQNQNQNQSISKLINTAASGNGLVGDVDELLTPMRIKSDPMSNGNGSGNGGKETTARPERNLWSRVEMLEMLNIMQEMNALDQLSDRNVKSEHVFRQIEEAMRRKGLVKKSSIQIWTKWKFLKSTYNTTTRHGNGIPKVVPEEVYRVLCRMLREHANANSIGSGISSECGNSRDSSNAELAKAVIKNAEVKEELGVEHPIFGFRLGLIKPEPLDTGYETMPINHHPNSSEEDLKNEGYVRAHDQTQALDHMPFTVNVKHEPEMDLGMDSTNTPPPTAPTSPSPPPSNMEQRDLDGSSTMYPSKSQSLSLPPLRVAAFANDAQPIVASTPTHGILQIERPVSQLNKPAMNGGPGRGNRSMALNSTSSINFVHPNTKLMLPRKQQPLRIPREISVQPANVRALKPVPVRDTGYMLRPDRMIPDLEQSISPPQSPSPPMPSQPMPKYSIPYASTSRQAQLLTEQQQPPRKRRLQFGQQSSPVPIKLQRSSTLYESPNQQSSIHNEDAAAAEEQRTQKLAEQAQRRKEQQDELFQKELSHLATAMREAQKEMLQNFFQQQKQFARREHQFQLKQDNLVMSALRKQTDVLLRAAKQLIPCELDEVEEVAKSKPSAKAKVQQQKDRSSSSLSLKPDIELPADIQKLEEEETEDEADKEDEELEQYEEETQESDECNETEAAVESSVNTASELSSNQSRSSIDAKIC